MYRGYVIFRTPRWRLVGAERGSRVLQIFPKCHCERVLAAEHAPRDPYHVPERRHGLAEIFERGASVEEERPRVNRPHLERGLITLSKNAPRNGHCFAQQRPGFFEAL